MIHRRLVREIQISLERFVDDPRAGTTVAVIQVDERPIEGERGLDLTPVALVGRHFFRRTIGNRRRRSRDLLIFARLFFVNGRRQLIDFRNRPGEIFDSTRRFGQFEVVTCDSIRNFFALTLQTPQVRAG